MNFYFWNLTVKKEPTYMADCGGGFYFLFFFWWLGLEGTNLRDLILIQYPQILATYNL